MDLSVDITSAVHEVIPEKPDISWKEAAKIGDECRTCGDGHNDHYASCIFGGYIALLLTFMAQEHL